MKISLLMFGLTITVLFVACSTNQPPNQSHCYQIKNESSATVALDFSYNGYIPTGAPTHIDMIPGGAYPASGNWCWTASDNSYATVNYSGPVQASWSGVLTLGNGYSASPSGTYTFTNLTRGSNPPTDTCIPNSFPGNNTFCLVSRGQSISLNCGWNNPSMNGTFNTYENMKIRCNNGREWTTTCTTDGTRCNLTGLQFCIGLTQWNVGQHCTEPLNGLSPNGI